MKLHVNALYLLKSDQGTLVIDRLCDGHDKEVQVCRDKLVPTDNEVAN